MACMKDLTVEEVARTALGMVKRRVDFKNP
jgi:hypothetical protein